MAKRNSSRNDSPKNHFDMFLKHFATASPRGGATHAADSLFELLYPVPPMLAATPGTTALSHHSADAIEKIALYQVGSVDEILKRRFALPEGLADSRVAVLNVTPNIIDYAPLTPSLKTPPIAPGRRIPVILGILPTVDAVEMELLRNGRLLAKYAACPEENTEQELFSPRGPMPSTEYWDAYAKYLHNRPQDAHPDPASPRRYRELLEFRQQIRDRRLQCLPEYTGIRRVKAREDDALAGSQAVFFRAVEMMLREAKECVASLVANPISLDHPDMAGMRKSILYTCDYIAVDEIREGGVKADALPASSVGIGVEASERNGSSEAAHFLLAKMKRVGQVGGEAWHDRHPDVDAALASLKNHPSSGGIRQRTPLAPDELSNYSFSPPKASPEYLSWPSLSKIAADSPLNGLMEKRNGALVDIDRERLEKRMRAYFDDSVPWDELDAMDTGLTTPQSRFDPKAVREEALASTGFEWRRIRRYTAKPFDDRWCYHSMVKSLWSDPNSRFAALCAPDNQFIAWRARRVVEKEGIPFFPTTYLSDGDLLRGYSHYFPLWFLDEKGERIANLSESMLKRLAALGILPGVPALTAARMVWNHVTAIGLSSAYLLENAEALDRGWPRMPFPTPPAKGDSGKETARSAFIASSRLGESACALFNLSTEIDGVTRGKLRLEFRDMAVVWDVENDTRFPDEKSTEIPVTMEWGRLYRKNAVLPSHGRLWSRPFTTDEKQCLEDGARAVGVHAGGAYACLGEETYDIHLNEKVAVRNIPASVWNFTVGGYPVLKKWLSYRETTILGRPLQFAEVETFQEIVRRIAALLLMTPRLNRNYAVIRDLHRPLESGER